MKKTQKEQIKAGGEIARARYQEFSKRPEWLEGLDEEERSLAIDALADLVQFETEALKLSTDDYSRLLRDGKDNHHEAREKACGHSHRLSAVHKLECLLRYGSKGDLSLYAREN